MPLFQPNSGVATLPHPGQQTLPHLSQSGAPAHVLQGVFGSLASSPGMSQGQGIPLELLYSSIAAGLKGQGAQQTFPKDSSVASEAMATEQQYQQQQPINNRSVEEIQIALLRAQQLQQLAPALPVGIHPAQYSFTGGPAMPPNVSQAMHHLMYGQSMPGLVQNGMSGNAADVWRQAMAPIMHTSQGLAPYPASLPGVPRMTPDHIGLLPQHQIPPRHALLGQQGLPPGLPFGLQGVPHLPLATQLPLNHQLAPGSMAAAMQLQQQLAAPGLGSGASFAPGVPQLNGSGVAMPPFITPHAPGLGAPSSPSDVLTGGSLLEQQKQQQQQQQPDAMMVRLLRQQHESRSAGSLPSDGGLMADGMSERVAKRLKRKQANRDSARRSRLRREAEADEMCAEVQQLDSANAQLQRKLCLLTQAVECFEAHNAALHRGLKLLGSQQKLPEDLVSEEAAAATALAELVTQIGAVSALESDREQGDDREGFADGTESESAEGQSEEEGDGTEDRAGSVVNAGLMMLAEVAA